MIMKPLHHIEQVLCRRILVRQDENPQPTRMRDAMIEPPPDVCGRSLLTTLQDLSPDAARIPPLSLKPRVDKPLRPVEQEGKRRSALGPYLQTPRRVVFEIVLEALADRPFLT
jgi:hypothetical protein